MDYKKVAVEASTEAGLVVKKFFNKKLDKISKGAEGKDFATKADLESEKIIIEIIKKYFPEHNFLAEENKSEKKSSEFTWVIDPLDGTTNFSRNIPLFSVSIALIKRDEIILGSVYNPISRELFFADSTGAYLNDKKINVSSNAKLSSSIVSQSFDYSNEKRKDNLKNIEKIFFKIEGFRLFHSTALELCNVACGKIDGYIVSCANPWDIAAGAFIVEKAGGKVTNFDGSNWNYMKPRIIATNGLIQGELLNVLR